MSVSRKRKSAKPVTTPRQRWFNEDGLLIGSGGRLHLLDDNGVVVETFKSRAEYLKTFGCMHCGDPVVLQNGPLCLDCAIDAHNEPLF